MNTNQAKAISKESTTNRRRLIFSTLSSSVLGKVVFPGFMIALLGLLSPFDVFAQPVTSTLKVVDSVPNNGVLSTSHLSSFELSFSEVIDPSTFTSDDVSINGANGAIEIASISTSDNQTFTVNFLSTIIENGDYTVAIGPNISTPGGGLMNQDEDALASESQEDVFQSSFTIEKIINNVQTHTSTISAHTTWSADTIHRISGNVSVNAGIILTIEPGAIVKFNQSSQLNIYGILVADGTESEKIIFTSYRDDSVGGNTNGGSADETGAPGDWYYLRFHDSVTESLTKFNHVIIRYAGQSNNNALYIDRADIEVVDCEISNNGYCGIYTYLSNALIENSVIHDNGHEGVRVDYNSVTLLNNQILDNVHSGIHSYRGTPTINGNVIRGNSWGIYHNNYQAAPVIQGNTITGNAATARLPVNTIPSSADGNVLGPNRRNEIRVIGSTLNKDLRFEVFGFGDGKELNTYQIESNISVANGTTLTVDPGVILKFSPNVYLDVYGTISAVGTAVSPVVFTSLYDDSYGGDFNLDGADTAPSHGDWQGIRMWSQSSGNLFEHAVVLYGGNYDASLYANTTDLTVRNSVIAHSNKRGVRSYRSTTVIEDTEIFANSWQGIYADSNGQLDMTGGRVYANSNDGLYYSGSVGGRIEGVEIFANTGNGLRNAGSAALDARGNWWGAVDGPGGDEPGSGDEVVNTSSGSITISDVIQSFLADGTQFSYLNAGPNTTDGNIATPVVVQGTDTTQFGTDATTRLLYDLDEVIVDYPSLEADKYYEAMVMYYNPDDTSGIGGTRQQLLAGAEPDAVVLHSRLLISRSTPTVYKVDVPQSSYSSGDLRLRFVRDNGYRSSVAQVWLLERSDLGDVAAPITTIDAPTGAIELTGSLVEIRGQVSDAGYAVGVEVGIDSGVGIIWRPVTQLNSDGSWYYNWSLPTNGDYTLYSRARDVAGNQSAAGPGVIVRVNKTVPAPATDLVASDAVGDLGGSIDLSWTLSADDGGGENDVVLYELYRRESSKSELELLGTVAAGVDSYVDTTATTGTDYTYRLEAIDSAGNRSVGVDYGPIAALDNSGDTVAPEEASDLVAVAGNGSVKLDWIRSVDSAGDLAAQLLDISTNGGASWGTPIRLSKSLSSYVVRDLTNGTNYRFRLRMEDTASPANVSAGILSDAVTPSETAFTSVSGTLGPNTVWTEGVYRVTGTLTVPSGGQLTILPGAVVKFNENIEMQVRGDLQVLGQSGNPAVFTAWTDDAYGGDSNGDGASSGTPGYWRRVYVINGGSAQFDHAVVRYGGRGNVENIYVESGAQLTVSDSTISDSSYRGVYAYTNTVLDIRNSTIENNANIGVYVYRGVAAQIWNNTLRNNLHGLYVRDNDAQIHDNVITNNDSYGVYFYSGGAGARLTGNTITDNNRSVRLPFAALPDQADGNTLAPNTLNDVRLYDGNLSRVVTLPNEVPVYYLEGNCTIQAGASVRVPAGTILKFENSSQMNVYGALTAIGTESEKIIFTSYRDDSVGGNTNGGSANESGVPGDWYYLRFYDQTLDFLTRLEHVAIRYAGQGNNNALYIDRADIKVVNCEISNNAHRGIYTSYSNALIENCLIRDNGHEGVQVAYGSVSLLNNQVLDNVHSGIYSYRGTPTINGNVISGNSWGIYHNDYRAAPVIQGNTITDNDNTARLPVNSLPSGTDENVLGPNKRNGIRVIGSTLNKDLYLEVFDFGEGRELNTYQIDSNITVANGTTLTVDPGVILKFNPSIYLDIYGTISAVGTAVSPVVFTSLYDDSYGGDFNLDGADTAASHGDWQGIRMWSQSSGNLFEHAVVLYCGNYDASLYANTTDLTVRNSVIAHSNKRGVRSYRSTTVIEDTEIFANGWQGVYADSYGQLDMIGGRVYANSGDGLYYDGSVSGRIEGVEIFANTGNGLRNNGSAAIDARGNWWGAVDGPGGDEPGSGDEVVNTSSGSITISDVIQSFLTDGTQFSYLNAGPNTTDGNIATPVVVQGTDTTQFGTDATTRLLYDLDEVVLDYPSLEADKYYEALVMYYNPDDTSGIGGTRQQLLAGAEPESSLLHPSLLISRSSPTVYKVDVPQSNYSSGDLRLRFVRDNGYRSSVAQVWLLERSDLGDVAAPITTIDAPTGAIELTGSLVEIRGQVSDAGYAVGVEVGIDSGAGIIWRPVTQLNSDGSWYYNWSLPTNGDYTLYSRARDVAGNQSAAGPGVIVRVNKTVPAPATDLVASDAVGDLGGSIDLSWTLSADDGGGENDVVLYELYRRESSKSELELLGTVAAGVDSYVDTTATTGTDYTYRLEAIDSAGNRSVGVDYGPIAALDNSGDTVAPEEASDLVAVAGNGSVKLDWIRSVDSAGDLAAQLLDISTNGGASWGTPIRLSKSLSSYVVRDLTNGTNYRFRLRMEDTASPANVSAGILSDAVTPSETAFTSVSGTLGPNTVWTEGVYRVTGTLTVPSGGQLTILPGAVVKFNENIEMQVRGDLQVLGQSGNPAVFTAWTDDAYGGDSNGDGASSGTPGYWRRVYVINGGSAQFDHAVVRYGGRGNVENIYVESGAQLTVSDSTISDSSYRGVYAYTNTVLDISNSTIENNANIGVYVYRGVAAQIWNNTLRNNLHGLYVRDNDAQIHDNVITNNDSYGVYFYSGGAGARLTGNTITDNNRSVRLPFAALPDQADGNTLAPNTLNDVRLYDGNLSRVVTLPNEVPVYYLEGNGTIQAGASVRVPAGTIWKFGNASQMNVYGALTAIGTENEKIIFTSYRDDSVGGNTNGGSADETGVPGDWYYLRFYDQTLDFLTRLEHVAIRYAGQGNNNALYIDRADIEVVDCEISNNGYRGIYTYFSNALIQDSVIRDNGHEGVRVDYNSVRLLNNQILDNVHSGIYSYRGTPTINDNVISGNSWGIYHNDYRAAPVIQGNTITDNDNTVRLPVNTVPSSADGNVLGPNRRNGIWVIGSTLNKDLRFELFDFGDGKELNTYRIESSIGVANGTTLTVDPGVILKFDPNVYVDVDGTISAVGTAASPVVFTSLYDDSYGGDFNLDGTNTAPSHGNWQGIRMWDASSGNLFEHAVVRYGGNYDANLYADRTDLTIRNSVIAHSNKRGVRSYRSTTTVENTEIFANNWQGIYADSTGQLDMTGGRIYANSGEGIYYNNSVSGRVEGVEIFANTGNGLRNNSSTAIDARGNWWGAVDGPGGDEPGSGDEVVNTSSGSITVSDGNQGFLTDGTEFSVFDAGGSDHYGYGIGVPIATGEASSEFGSAPEYTMLQDFVSQQIKVEYTGLEEGANYDVHLTYLNKDSGGARQITRDENGEAIHPSIALSSSVPSVYVYPINSDSIINGNLRLDIEATQGSRAVVQMVNLFKSNSSDTVAPIITIDTPVDGEIRKGGTVPIRGIAEDLDSGLRIVEVMLSQVGNTASAAWRPVQSLNADGIWFYGWIINSDGDYQVDARAVDKAGNFTEVATVNFAVDATAPAPVTDFLASGLVDGVVLNWTVSVDDGNDVVDYEIYRSTEGLADEQLTATLEPGSSSYLDTTAVVDTDYFYFVRTRDSAGYEVDSSVEGPVGLAIEEDVTPPEDVTNLTATPTQVNGENLSAYLQWQSSVDTAGDLAAYRLYGSADGGTTVGANAPVFDDGNFIQLSKGRVDYQVGDLQANSQYTFRLTAIDFAGNESIGATVEVTPTGAASEVLSFSGSLSEDLYLGAGTYHITGSLTVPAGITLHLGSGAIFKFNSNAYLYVNGQLITSGQANLPVVFTSWNDDAYGGDSNNDGPSSGSPGYWRQIDFRENSVGDFEHTVVRYAGGANTQSVYAYRANVVITDSTIENSGYRGLYLRESEVEISNSIIRNNSNLGIYVYDAINEGVILNDNLISDNGSHGVYVYNNTLLTVNGNTIRNNNGWAVYHRVSSSSPVMVNNLIEGNLNTLHIPMTALPDDSNDFIANTVQDIHVHGATINNNTTFSVFNPNTADELSVYRILGSITVAANVTLTVDPGVTFRFNQNTGLYVYGGIEAIGTLEDKIVFTAATDNGSSTLPTNGYWYGISHYDSVLEQFSRLENVVIRYAGNSESAALYLYRADIMIENTEISNSSTHGIRIYEASPQITGSRIWGNNTDGIYIERSPSSPVISFCRISTNLRDGIRLYNNANATLTNNDLFGNRSYGINNTTGNQVDASQSWWGDVDATGPQHSVDNTSGTGDRVSDNVTFTPYKTAAPVEYGSVNFAASGLTGKGSIEVPTIIQGTLTDEWGTSPERSVVTDPNAIMLGYTGLDPAKRYQVRVGYFTADPVATYQSLTDGNGGPIHGSIQLPNVATQYEYSIPQNYYVDGNLSLDFNHDSSGTAIRAAVAELWLIEDTGELSPPRFEAVAFNDRDGDLLISIGDEYYFYFSEQLDSSLIQDGSTDANDLLQASGGALYGTLNQVRWSADEKTVIVTITEGFTIEGNETITLNGLTDAEGNFAVGSRNLSLEDEVVPQLIGLDWDDLDGNSFISLGDTYRFHFDEAMNTSVIVDGTNTANGNLRPEGGLKYGTINTINWSADGYDLTVTITDGFSVKGDELVTPTAFVTDVAGNAVQGTANLLGLDLTSPEFVQVFFDDADGNGNVSIGDRYVFQFNEIMRNNALSNGTAEANNNLSPDGKRYGIVNDIEWSDDFREVAIRITDGFTITGNETVSGSQQVTDLSGNALGNTIDLNTLDTVAPTIVEIKDNATSPVPVTDNYQLIVQFSSAMNTTVEPVVTIDAAEGTDPVVASGGSWSTTLYPNDTYTTPGIVLNYSSKGQLDVSVSQGQDLAGNVMQAADSAYQFYIQPASPVITSHALSPTVHVASSSQVVISGQRSNETSIWINDVERVVSGNGPWSVTLNLPENDSLWEITARDDAGNASIPATLEFLLDTTAPQIDTINPANGSFVENQLLAINVQFVETGSGIDISNSTLEVLRDGVSVAGTWSVVDPLLSFTPTSEFQKGTYTINLQLSDAVGLLSTTVSESFTFDPIRLITEDTFIDVDDLSYENSNLKVEGATLTLSGRHTFSKLHLANGAVLTHLPASMVGDYHLDLVVGDLIVDADSLIDVSALGLKPEIAAPRVGGSYGGKGGGLSTPTYGDAIVPMDFGSGGGNEVAELNSRGGGAFWLEASRLFLEGMILANGEDGALFTGGGSGGSILLDLGVLTGSGFIQANGGWGTSDDPLSPTAGGGGGRIAIYYDTLDSFDIYLQVQAEGGAGEQGGDGGAAGSLYVENKAQPSAIRAVRLDNLFDPEFPFIEVEFINAIDPGTFEMEDVSLLGPNGVVALSQIISQSRIHYVIYLGEVLVEGDYQLIISTDIQTYSGASLDQNGNGVASETQDQFNASFTIEQNQTQLPRVNCNCSTR